MERDKMIILSCSILLRYFANAMASKINMESMNQNITLSLIIIQCKTLYFVQPYLSTLDNFSLFNNLIKMQSMFELLQIPMVRFFLNFISILHCYYRPIYFADSSSIQYCYSILHSTCIRLLHNIYTLALCHLHPGIAQEGHDIIRFTPRQVLPDCLTYCYAWLCVCRYFCSVVRTMRRLRSELVIQLGTNETVVMEFLQCQWPGFSL